MRGGMAPSRGRLTSGQGPSRLAGAGIGAWGARAPRANGFPPLWRWASATASPPFCVAASLTHTLGACGMDASASACAAADAAARAPAVALTASCASDACAGVAVATFIAEATAAKSAMAKPPWPEKRSARRERAQRRMVAEGGGAGEAWQRRGMISAGAAHSPLLPVPLEKVPPRRMTWHRRTARLSASAAGQDAPWLVSARLAKAPRRSWHEAPDGTGAGSNLNRLVARTSESTLQTWQVQSNRI